MGHGKVCLVIDTGCVGGNVISEQCARRLRALIQKTKQGAVQVDGKTQLEVMGQVEVKLTCGSKELKFRGLVVKDLDAEMLAGTDFMADNDVYARPAKQLAYIQGEAFKYGNEKAVTTATVGLCSVMRLSEQATIMPGETIEVCLPRNLATEQVVCVEPRLDREDWPAPGVHDVLDGSIVLCNHTREMQSVKRNGHFAQVRPVMEKILQSEGGEINKQKDIAVRPADILGLIEIGSSVPAGIRAKFEGLHEQYVEVFGPVRGKCNGCYGKVKAVVNIGSTIPPQHRGQMPLYSRNNLLEYQDHIDELDKMRATAKPSDVGVTVELVHPSFLVNKASGGKRFVTSFTALLGYERQTPSMLPDVESVLRLIAQRRSFWGGYGSREVR